MVAASAASQKALRTKLYQSEAYKLTRKYRRLDLSSADPEVTSKAEQLIQEIEKYLPLEQAVKRLEKLEGDVRTAGIAVRDMKSEIKIIEEIRELYYQPEQTIEIGITETAKQEIREQFSRGKNHKSRTDRRKDR